MRKQCGIYQYLKALEIQRNNLLQVEEVIWTKKNGEIWLKHDDRNTDFFHG